MSRIKRVLGGRTTLALGAWVAYVLAFTPLYRLLGAIVPALAILPAVVTGWALGMRAGLLAGLLIFPLNMLLTTLVTGTVWGMMTPGGLLGSVLMVLLGAVVGRLRDLGEQVKRELTERKRAEEELRRHRDHLEELAGERTAELRKINEELLEEIAERKRAEEALKEYSERLEEMVEERTAELKTANEQLRLEIADRKQVEEALQESEAKFRTIFETVTDMITYVDTHGRILDVNDRVEDLLGYKRDEVIGRNFARLGVLGLRDLPKMVRLFRDTIRAGEAVRMVELEIKRKNGSKVFVEVGTRFIKKNGKVGGVVNVFRDITERKRAEREVEERRMYLEGVLGAAPDAIVTLDAHHRVVEWNAGAEGLFGYSREEVIGQNIDDLVTSPDTFEEAVGFTQIVMGGGEVPPVETVRYQKDGSPVDVIVAGSPILVGDEFIGAVAVYTDITDRKLVEEALRESEEQYRNLVEHQGEGIGIVDIEERFSFANPAAHEIFGVPPGSLVGRNLEEFVDKEGAATVREQTEMRQVGQASVYEMDIIRPDGQRRRLLVTARPQYDHDGQFRGTFGIFRDITDRKRAEAERERLLVAEREQRLLAETLAEVALALTSLTSHEAVLDEILRQVRRIVPYNTANIALLEDDFLRIAHWQGYEAFGTGELISNLLQPLDDFLVDAEAVRLQRPVVIPDTRQEPRWVVFPETDWIRSYLVVPIFLHDRVLGLLRLDSDTPGEFSAEDVKRLQPLANAAAIALENARLFGEVQRLAITDGLTGMYNRRHFFELAENELNRARRFRHTVSAIMLDVDHFKQVNDTYGHAVGDQVLRVLAERCRESIRDIDILGRYGGEEFAIILPATDLSGAVSMAERLRQCISDTPILTERGDIAITTSLGVASSVQPDGDVATLLNRADAAMYAAKQAGRNRVATLPQSLPPEEKMIAGELIP